MYVEEIKKAIEVMQAFVDGKKVELWRGDYGWVEDINPSWDFELNTYRIKPEPHYRPFKNAEEVMEAIKEHGDWIKYRRVMGYYKITYYANDGVQIADCAVDSYTIAFEYYTFLDGTPFGKLEE